LGPEDVKKLAAELAARRDEILLRRPVEEIIEAVAAACELLRPGGGLNGRWESALADWTGYAASSVSRGCRYALDELRAERMRALLADVFGGAAVLDGFVAAGGRRLRAYGPRVTVQIAAGNVPAVTLHGLARALLLKSAVLVKSASGEPFSVPLFCRALHQVDPELARCVAAVWWPGGEEDLEAAAFSEAEAVVASGGDEAIASLHRRLPAHVRFVAYGHRISLAVVAREMSDPGLWPRTAAPLADEICHFDQQGCVSPQLVYVEEGGRASPAQFAEALAAELAEREGRPPRSPVGPKEAAAILRARSEAEMAAIEGRDVRLHASEGTAWTVIYDEDPVLRPSPLFRTVYVKPVGALERLPGILRPYRRHLQTVGHAVGRERLPALPAALGEAGVVRLAPLGSMSEPSLLWRQDGRSQLIELARWVEVEEGG